MYNCLILSHAFNMDGRASSQTITDKIPYLLKKDWNLFVLSAVTGNKDQRFPHLQLFAWGPAAFRFDFRHWCALRYGRGLRYRVLTAIVSLIVSPLIIIERTFVGLSSQWSWSIPAAIRGYFWIRKYKINLIYSTGGAWSAHLAAWWLNKFTKVRWIAEIHDPLVERTGKEDDGNSPRRTREAHIRQRLEQIICTDSSLCWWFTEGALFYARQRNPGLGLKGFYVLPGAEPTRIFSHYKRRSELHISHFGSLSQSRSLSMVIQSLIQFYSTHSEADKKIKLHVYGSMLDSVTSRIMHTSQIAHSVVEHGRLEFDAISGISGRDQVTSFMQTTDYLLLLHGDQEFCAEYIPSKLYEYWWAKRPILAITHQNQQLDSLIHSISPQNYVCHTTDGQQGILKLLEFAWVQWKSENIDSFISQRKALTPEDSVNQIAQHLSRS